MNRNTETYECAIGRVLDYLSRSGVELTPEAVCKALHIIEHALSQGEGGALQRAIDDLPLHFDLPVAPVPDATPPIHRGSIGYG